MVDVFTRHSDMVETVEDAWRFVMAHVDDYPRPNIEIKHRTIYPAYGTSVVGDDPESESAYEVTIYGSHSA